MIAAVGYARSWNPGMPSRNIMGVTMSSRSETGYRRRNARAACVVFTIRVHSIVTPANVRSNTPDGSDRLSRPRAVGPQSDHRLMRGGLRPQRRDLRGHPVCRGMQGQPDHDCELPRGDGGDIPRSCHPSVFESKDHGDRSRPQGPRVRYGIRVPAQGNRFPAPGGSRPGPGERRSRRAGITS